MSTTTLNVSGMTCQHCVAAVTRALKKVPGVESAQVSLELGQATVAGSADTERLLKAIEQEGYRAVARA
ncbi:Heavy metal transport/detoxification protein [Burkholderiales bacterium]|nr:Heavy metal transport/detoxification protein [Burkholderiales bacterium]